MIFISTNNMFLLLNLKKNILKNIFFLILANKKVFQNIKPNQSYFLF